MKRVRGGASNSRKVKCDCKINGETKPSKSVQEPKFKDIGQTEQSQGNNNNEGQPVNGNGNNNGLPQNEAQGNSTGQAFTHQSICKFETWLKPSHPQNEEQGESA